MILNSFTIIGDDSGAFWTMLGVIALIISFYFIVRQIRIQNYANMISFMESSENKWRSDKYVKTRKKVCSKSSKKIDVDHEILLSFFEDLGILYKRKVIDIKLIWEKFSYYIEHYWIILEPNIKAFQNEKNDTTWYENFENLSYKIVNYSKKMTGNKDYHISDKDIKKFKASEIK